MAIDRRDFLKFAVGGAVGTMLTPLPWVSMDEAAKWTQRWGPVLQRGGTSFLNSVCKLCPGGCGIRIRLIEQKRAVKIEGNPNHPVNRGGLCPLGLAGLQYLYYEENRVKTPLKRDGARGFGDWRPITWEEALYQITVRLKELREKDLPHTVALVDGEKPGSQGQLLARFLKAYGTPNYIRPFQLSELEEIVTQTLHGVRAGITYDLPRSRYILSFGAALLDGWGNPSWVGQAFQEWRQESPKAKTRLVQIEPLASTTASMADEWVAIRPGTEGILALGLAQVMIEKGWFHKEPVQSRMIGLEELRGLLNKNFTPEQTARATEIPRETIEKLARDFSSAEQPVALWGKGKGELPISLFESQAIHILNILAGSINRPGGVYLQSGFPYVSWPKLSLDKTAEKGLAQPRLDGAMSPKYPKTGNLACNLFENAARKTPYPVNLLFLNEVNPVFCLGERHFLRALEKIPFVVCFSSFMDETANLADLILPVSTFLERWDDTYNCQGVPFPIYGLTKPVFPPLYDTKSSGETILALAKNLGEKIEEALPYEKIEEVFKQAARGLFNSRKGRLTDGPLPEAGKYAPAHFESFDKFWEQLVAQGTWYDLENKSEGGKGKWDFSAATLQAPAPRPQSQKEYPLWLIPQSLMLLQSGYLPNPPFLTKYLGEEVLIKNTLVVQIHPETARSLSLSEGSPVEIQSANGRIKALIHLFEGARPGCVFVPLGMGHKAFDPTLKDRGANPYPILDSLVDPQTGMEVAWATRVKIVKV